MCIGRESQMPWSARNKEAKNLQQGLLQINVYENVLKPIEDSLNSLDTKFNIQYT